ncbi:hypothetical protein TNCV_2585551 [Trichonephila clavipes]|nr:hypothetical protein TNCV_2585551 [Trichonephila clavipes]
MFLKGCFFEREDDASGEKEKKPMAARNQISFGFNDGSSFSVEEMTQMQDIKKQLPAAWKCVLLMMLSCPCSTCRILRNQMAPKATKTALAMSTKFGE